MRRWQRSYVVELLEVEVRVTVQARSKIQTRHERAAENIEQIPARQPLNIE